MPREGGLWEAYVKKPTQLVLVLVPYHGIEIAILSQVHVLSGCRASIHARNWSTAAILSKCICYQGVEHQAILLKSPCYQGVEHHAILSESTCYQGVEHQAILSKSPCYQGVQHQSMLGIEILHTFVVSSLVTIWLWSPCQRAVVSFMNWFSSLDQFKHNFKFVHRDLWIYHLYFLHVPY